MAVAHRDTQSAGDTTTSLAIASVDASAGTDLGIICKISYKDNSGGEVTGVAWDVATENQAFTQVGSEEKNGECNVQMWELGAPVSKTATITITTTNSVRIVGAGSVYTGVDQTNPIRAASVASANGTTGSTADITVDVVALDTEMVIDSAGQCSAGPDTIDTQTGTARSNDTATGGGNDTRGMSQEILQVADNTETMAYNMSDDDNWAIIAASLQEPAALTPGATDIKNDATLSTDLVSAWLSDESGLTTDLVIATGNTLTNSGVVESDGGGKNGDAGDFENTAETDYLQRAQAGIVGLKFTGNVSFNTWINFESLPAAQNNIVSRFLTTGGNRSYIWYLLNNASDVDIHWFESSDGGTGNIVDTAVTWTAPSTSTWYMLTITFDATAGIAKAYVNASQIGADMTGHNNSIYAGVADFDIGTISSISNISIDGLLHQVLAYGKILTDQEMVDLYNNGDGIFYEAAVTAAVQDVIGSGLGVPFAR